MLPLAMSAILSRQKPLIAPEGADRDIVSCWYIAFAMIAGHMMVLALLLKGFYGYGYERDVPVLGNLSLYLLLFLLIWRRLDSTAFRRLAGVALLIFYITVTIANRFA
jgi:Ca2+/Na+ antiporter